MSFVLCMEWSFSPKDYFEKDMKIHIGGRTLEISQDGIVKLEICEQDIKNLDIYKLRDSLTQQLSTLFLGVQSITGEVYNLEPTGLYERYPDGSRSHLLSATVNIDSCKAFMDFIIKDKNGRVIQNTKKERIAHKQKTAKLIKSFFYKDLCLRSILYSYERSLKEPDNRLIHLYDIKAAIENQIDEQIKKKSKSNKKQKKEDVMVNCLSQFQLYILGGECVYDVDNECIYKKRNQCSDRDCRSKLKKGSIEDLRKLANSEIKQGRHRGDHFSKLRDATESELREADKIARCLIEAYIKYLENNSEY